MKGYKDKMNISYEFERYVFDISTVDYFERFVDVGTFLECCKECPNYNTTWSCPPYDFNPKDVWKAYTSLHLIGIKILLSEEARKEEYSPIMLQKKSYQILKDVKEILSKELFLMEQDFAGSMALLAGSCSVCGEGKCSRRCGKACIVPEKMRYSVESIGGDVGKTAKELWGIELLWAENGRLAEYMMLVGGLLK